MIAHQRSCIGNCGERAHANKFSANRCKFDGTNIGTTQKPFAATPNAANVYAIRQAHWKCGAG
jgi:hypothetical protein